MHRMNIQTDTPERRRSAHGLVERYYAAFNRQDWPAMLELLADDVVHDINQGGRETGRAAFAAFLQRMDRCYRERLSDIVLMTDDEGTRVAAEYVVHGEYHVADEGLPPPASGQRYVLPGGAFFTLEAGRIVRISNYYNLQDWLDQVSSPRPA